MSLKSRWWESATLLKLWHPKAKGRTLKNITGMLDTICDWGFNSILPGAPYHGGMQYYGLDVIDYYTVDPALGDMDDFQELVEECHNRGIAVVVLMNLGYSALKFPAFQKACDDVAAGIDSPESRWFVWSDDNFAELDRSQVPYFMSDIMGHWQYSERAGKYYWVKWRGEYGDEDMPQFNFAEPTWQEECRKAVRFWMEQGVDGMVIDAANEYNNCSWEINNSTITDVVHEYPNTFVLPEGAGKRNDPAAWITEGHYDSIFNYAIVTHRPWEQVIVRALEDGNPKGIEYNLRWYRDRVVAAGGVTWAHPVWMENKSERLTLRQMMLEAVTLATVGELLNVSDIIYDEVLPSNFLAELKKIIKTRTDYPALGPTGFRRRLPTNNDNLYYAFLRQAPLGEQTMLVVLNFRNEHRVMQVYLDTPAELIDVFSDNRQKVTGTLQLSLPPYGYRIFNVKS